MSAASNVTVLDPSVTFDYIGPGQTVTSEDTFAIRVDWSKLINPVAIEWLVAFDWPNSGGSGQQVLAASTTLEQLIGDFDGTGKVDFRVFLYWLAYGCGWVKWVVFLRT